MVESIHFQAPHYFASYSVLLTGRITQGVFISAAGTFINHTAVRVKTVCRLDQGIKLIFISRSEMCLVFVQGSVLIVTLLEVQRK